VDALAEIFLQRGILNENRPDRRQRQVARRPLPADIVAGVRKPCASAGLFTSEKNVGSTVQGPAALDGKRVKDV